MNEVRTFEDMRIWRISRISSSLPDFVIFCSGGGGGGRGGTRRTSKYIFQNVFLWSKNLLIENDKQLYILCNVHVIKVTDTHMTLTTGP